MTGDEQTIVALRAENARLAQRVTELERQLQTVAVAMPGDLVQRIDETYDRALIRNLPNATVFLFDRDLRYQVAGGANLALVGLTPAMLEGKTIWDCLPPDLCAVAEPFYQAILAGTAPPAMEQQFGDRIYLTHSLPMRNRQGEVEAGMIVSIDITERKQIEETLRRYRQIVSSIPDAVSLVDSAYVYRVVNGAYLKRTTRSYDEIVDHTVAEIMGSDVFDTLIKAELDRCLNGETVQYRAWFEFPSEGWRFVDVTYAPYRDEGGTITGVLVSARDITDLKQAEEDIQALSRDLARRAEELESLNHDLEVFGYAVAHHLRSPLWTIRLCVESLRDDYGDRLDTAGLELINDLEETAHWMKQIVDRLLNLSSAIHSERSIEPVHLSGLVQDIADALRERAPDRRAIFDIAPDIVVVGDPQLLRIVLENLLENAWKYTSKQPEAVISFGMLQQTGRDERVYFVRDNGVGFDQAQARAIFWAFQRLHMASEFPGTGIGLAMVRRIVHLHGGEVWTEATPGQGATFYFTLG